MSTSLVEMVLAYCDSQLFPECELDAIRDYSVNGEHQQDVVRCGRKSILATVDFGQVDARFPHRMYLCGKCSLDNGISTR